MRCEKRFELRLAISQHLVGNLDNRLQRTESGGFRLQTREFLFNNSSAFSVTDVPDNLLPTVAKPQLMIDPFASLFLADKALVTKFNQIGITQPECGERRIADKLTFFGQRTVGGS